MRRFFVGLFAAAGAGLLALAASVSRELVWATIAAGAVSTGLAASLALGPVKSISFNKVRLTIVRQIDWIFRKTNLRPCYAAGYKRQVDQSALSTLDPLSAILVNSGLLEL